MRKLGAIAPQFSLNQSTSDPMPEPPKLPETASVTPAPSIEALQKAYNTAIGRSIIETQIARNPDWGYEIVDGEIVESIPF